MTYSDLNYLREILNYLRAHQDDEQAQWLADILEDVIYHEQ